METVNYTDFRSNLKHWFDKVVNDVSDIVIKRKSGKDLVLISLDEYNSLKETTYLLTGKNRDVLLNAIKELEAGKGVQKDVIEEMKLPWATSALEDSLAGQKGDKKIVKRINELSKSAMQTPFDGIGKPEALK